MEFSRETDLHAAAIAELFRATFTASEGAEEGELIGGLARRLMSQTPPDDLRVFSAWESGVLIGAILFTRLAFADDRTVFLLAPVAVATDRQRQGVGQALIRHGLGALRAEAVDVAVTYGDPAFYGRVGFLPVTVAEVPAPHALNHPHGWLGQSLTAAPLSPLEGPSRCVAAFDDPRLW